MKPNHEEVLVRALDVTVRRGEEEGLLLETLVGRYLLNSDARAVWQQIDGRRSVREVAESVAAAQGEPVNDLHEPVEAICTSLLGLRLVERW
ncbi:PqqD family protein (plasmid) [Streptomyces sp. NBC_01216]|uniref:PqqD family protein n=1 Tax=Streptomyces sp. NBC_01216 TaxID=2903778 RepID=UPI002E0E2337|nr:PqqD family protein [Streptomyces sp. NBC_01216]